MVKVEKRDGRIVDFNKEKIVDAVNGALSDIGKENRELALDVMDSVLPKIRRLKTDVVNVEEIQDLVEETLIEANLNEVAKSYIIYRQKRRDARVKNFDDDFDFFSKDFISNYKHKPNPFPTELGEFIYYRTYSRWLPEQLRRENWWETVRRAVGYNTSLAPTSKEEKQKLFENVYSLKNFLAGRTLWTGGTESSKKYPMSNYNCAFTIIDDFESYSDLFYLLMIGAGVGIRILPEDVNKLPKLRNDFNIIHKYFEPVPKEERAEFTTLKFDNDAKTVTIDIGDSKEGWVQALEKYLELLYRHEYKIVNKIIFNYDSVRPKGERLKTFGGTASGHESLKIMFNKIKKILDKKNKDKDIKLKPVDAMDIANIIGENVVSGGVRRTSEVVLFDKDDEDVLTAKNDLYKKEDGEWKINEDLIHRKMSNNSIFYDEKPSREQLNWQIKQMRYSGEPGFMNVEEASRRRDNLEGANPCFTGDMELLTSNGYERFDELEKFDKVTLINKDGKISHGKVWSNGIKETVELKLSTGDSIKCTPDHKFMTVDGESLEASDLLDKELKGYDEEVSNVFVEDIIDNGKEEVFDFSEPKTHWGVVEGFIAHNCMEILLDSDGMCNLTSLNVRAFVEDGELDREEIFEAQRLSVRAAYRMALVEFELHNWDNVNKRDRLIGTSLTGWQDAMNALDWNDFELINREDMEEEDWFKNPMKETEGIRKQKKLLQELREVAHEEAENIANELNDNVPKLVTTIKPEGTQTQMPTVSSGLHFSHSEYYIRRVRISSEDPLAKALEEQDFIVKPDNGEDKDNPSTVVVEFPVKAPEGKTKKDVSAIEQLEIYKMFMRYYVDHNASITVHVRDDEWEDVKEWMWYNWDDVVAVSFLSYDDSFYDLMPYEEISKEKYEEMFEKLPKLNPGIVNFYEQNRLSERELEDSSCESGVCPVR